MRGWSDCQIGAPLFEEFADPERNRTRHRAGDDGDHCFDTIPATVKYSSRPRRTRDSRAIGAAFVISSSVARNGPSLGAIAGRKHKIERMPDRLAHGFAGIPNQKQKERVNDGVPFTFSRFATLLLFPDLLTQIALVAHLDNLVQLGFQPIDVTLLVLQKPLEQLP